MNSPLIKGILFVLSLLVWGNVSFAQDICNAHIANRSTQVDATCDNVAKTCSVQPFSIRNVPVEPGNFRVRLTCGEGENSIFGQSPFIQFAEDGADTIFDTDKITYGNLDPIPVSISIDGGASLFTSIGETAAFNAIATLPDGSSLDISDVAFWASSNPNIARVDQRGRVTATGSGEIALQVRHEGVLASRSVRVAIPNDSDGDGMTDDYERGVGLDPTNPSDASLDNDGDGLSNFEEFELGTRPDLVDTDGDGLSDFEERSIGTNPTVADSDDDGLLDGEEILLGTDPNNADTDGDGIDDGTEQALGLSPFGVDATTRVEGIVLDDSGESVAEIGVRLFDRLVTTTGLGGAFAFDAVPVTVGPLVAEARMVRQGKVFAGISSPSGGVSGGVTNLGVIQLREVSGVVAGTVTGPRGNTIAGARVLVRSTQDERSVLSDLDGIYQIEQFGDAEDTSTGEEVLAVATDPSSGLRGQSRGGMSDKGSTVLNVRLRPAGTIRGVVYQRDGETRVGAGVAVVLEGPERVVVETDEYGEYRVEFLPLGMYGIEAGDVRPPLEQPQPFSELGDRGKTSALIAATNQVVIADVTYLGRGLITGVVSDANGVPAPGVAVAARSLGLFPGIASTTTDAQGLFTIRNAFIGELELTAIEAGSNLAGNARTNLFFDGESAEVSITLEPAGSISGRVLTSEGEPAGPGGYVEIGTQIVDIVGDGEFIVPFLPLDEYFFTVVRPNGERAGGRVELVTPGAEVPVIVRLSGLGSVEIHVVDADGVDVADALVMLTLEGEGEETMFQGMSDLEGKVSFESVRAAPFRVQVSDPEGIRGGTLRGELGSGEFFEGQVILEPTGSISGTVRVQFIEGESSDDLESSNPTEPVPGIKVLLQPGDRSVVSDSKGKFRFDLVPVAGSHTLTAIDSQGTERAVEDGIALAGQSDEQVRTLLMSTLGRVEGTVSEPDGSSSPGARVTVEALVTGFRPKSVTADEQGHYVVEHVPPGLVIVTAASVIDSTRGTAQLGLQAEEQGVTINVSLRYPGTGTLPENTPRAQTRTFLDGNQFPYSITPSGSLQQGQNNVFGRGNASRLSVRYEGEEFPFLSSATSITINRGRGVEVTNEGPEGLQIYRRTYVPGDGYFARYLEVFENTGENSLTFDVVVSSSYAYDPNQGGALILRPRIPLTSSGDDILNAGLDNWAIIQGERDADPFFGPTLPPVVALWSDGRGEQRPTNVAFETDDIRLSSEFVTEWRNVRVAPGEKKMLLHFVMQQVSRVGAQASAERIVLLPPEALAELNYDERSSIVNFELPLNGVSALEELPDDGGKVTGDVFAPDGEAALSGIEVHLKSTSPYFGRTYVVSSRTAGIGVDKGSFVFAAGRRGGKAGVFPLVPFSYTAIDRPSRVMAMGDSSFLGDVKDADLQITLEGGSISGVVRRADGAVASSGTVTITGPSLPLALNETINLDGVYSFPSLLPGQYTLFARLTNSQGATLSGTALSEVQPFSETKSDITLGSTGSVRITLRDGSSNPVIDYPVSLIKGQVSLNGRTDTGGRFTFIDVPVDTYSARAVEQITGVATAEQVDVIADTQTDVEVQLTPVGSIAVNVRRAEDDSVVEGAVVSVRNAERGISFIDVGVTDVNGSILVAQQPGGTTDVRVLDPRNMMTRVQETVEVTEHRGTHFLNLLLPLDGPPLVKLQAPVQRTTFLKGTNFIVTAEAEDDVAVSDVEFFIDDVSIGTRATSPFSINTTFISCDGRASHILKAVARDGAGNRAEDEIEIFCVEDAPPTVSISAPAPGAQIREGAPFVVDAAADDLEGVSQVTFLLNGTPVITDAQPPYATTMILPPCPGGATADCGGNCSRYFR